MPKKIEISDKMKKINDDWQKYFHQTNKNDFAKIISWGHEYVVKNSPKNFKTTLEIGPGLGEHLNYEKLTTEQKDNYYGLEIRDNMAEEIKAKYPFVKLKIGDCQEKINLPDKSVDRIIAIHLLEHLENLEKFLKQARSILSRKGVLLAVIPCEGGLGYSLGRSFTTKRMFEKRYKMPYRNFIQYEHPNTASKVLKLIPKYFVIIDKKFYPLGAPLVDLNLVIGLKLAPKD